VELVGHELGRLGKSSIVPGLTQRPQLLDLATHLRPLVVLKPDKPVTSGDNIILIKWSEGGGIPAKAGCGLGALYCAKVASPTVSSSRC
jgi:hypothetical protein